MEKVTIMRGNAEYEDTLKDIERSIGIVPGFMKALPQDVLVRDWAHACMGSN